MPSLNQSATARIATNKTATQSATARIATNIAPTALFNGDFEIAPATNVPQTTSSAWINGTAGGSVGNVYNWAFLAKLGTAAVMFDNSTSHSGLYSMKLSTTSVGSQAQVSTVKLTTLAGMATAIPARPNTKYTMTYWMKTNLISGSAGNGAYGTISTRDGTGALIAESVSTPVTTTTGWTKYSTSITTGATIQFITPKVEIVGNDGAATLIMDAWFDDIVITSPSQQAAVARLANNRTATQAAVARIAISPTKAQMGLARIARNITATQPATAHITAVTTNVQTAKASIINSGVRLQTAVGRIAVTGVPNTNIAKYSQKFSLWGNNVGSTIIDNTYEAPDGTITAGSFTNTGSGTGRYITDITVIGKTYTHSLYVKYVSGGVAWKIGTDNFNITVDTQAGAKLSTFGTLTAWAITPVGNNWYRVSVSYVATSASHAFIIYGSGTPGTMAAWGAQLEAATGPNTYIPVPSVTPITFIGARQPSLARIVATPTTTQLAKARIVATITKTQPATSRIVAKLAITQTSTAHIVVNVLRSAIQTARSRISRNPTSIQTSTASLIGNRSADQSAKASIINNTFIGTPIMLDQARTETMVILDSNNEITIL